MDMMTGRIYDGEEIKRLKDEGLEEIEKRLVEIDPMDMTPKQKAEKQVSPNDNRSTLGRMYTSARKLRKAAMKSGRRR